MFASSGKFPGSGLTPTRRSFPAALPAASGLPRFSFPLQLRGSAGLTPASFPRRSNFRGYIFENAALLLNILLFHRRRGRAAGAAFLHQISARGATTGRPVSS